MTSNAGHRDYDENLLASAPVATKAQLQSGYNPDLLVEKATPPPSRRDVERRGSSRNSSPVEQADHEPMPAKVPFYRTRKGIIIIAIVVLVVIIAAAVGGAVGSRKKNSGATDQTLTAGSSATSGSTLSGDSQTAGGALDSTTLGATLSTSRRATAASSSTGPLPPPIDITITQSQAPGPTPVT